MPSWLKSLTGFFTGLFAPLWNKVLSLVTTVYRWLDKAVTVLRNDLDSLFADVFRFADSVSHFIYHTYNLFVNWVDKTFNDVIKWAGNWISKVEHYANGILAWVVQRIDSVSKWVTSLFNGLYKWIISNIWTPLYRDVTGAIRWIEHEGMFTYDLLTHPDKLVKLIIAYIWIAWLDLFRQFAKPITVYILQH